MQPRNSPQTWRQLIRKKQPWKNGGAACDWIAPSNAILVTDRFALHSASGKIEMNLMTPCGVRPEGAHAVVLSGGLLGTASVRIAVHSPAPPAFRTEEIAITDSRLRGSWGDRLYRTVVAWPSLPAAGELQFEITQL